MSQSRSFICGRQSEEIGAPSHGQLEDRTEYEKIKVKKGGVVGKWRRVRQQKNDRIDRK
jgi:hypothetical protein